MGSSERLETKTQKLKLWEDETGSGESEIQESISIEIHTYICILHTLGLRDSIMDKFESSLEIPISPNLKSAIASTPQ